MDKHKNNNWVFYNNIKRTIKAPKEYESSSTVTSKITAWALFYLLRAFIIRFYLLKITQFHVVIVITICLQTIMYRNESETAIKRLN